MRHFKRMLAGAAVSVAVVGGLASPPTAAADQNAENPAENAAASSASFFEPFDRVDPERWFISNGWTNGAHQNCTWSAKNFRISAGVLELILSKNGPDDPPPEKASEARLFSCAELQTHKTYGYGTYEFRASAAAAPGLVTGFFTYVGPTPQAQNPHDEIDFEFLGKDRRAVQLNYFGAGQGQHELMAPLSFDASQTMANYAFQWEPGSIRWFVNGAPVHEVKAEADKPLPKTPGKIYLSFWGSDTLEAWLGKFADPGQPLLARFEWMAFTKAGESCRFSESILCKGQKPGEAMGN